MGVFTGDVMQLWSGEEKVDWLDGMEQDDSRWCDPLGVPALRRGALRTVRVARYLREGGTESAKCR
jgi:hypothetical protein